MNIFKNKDSRISKDYFDQIYSPLDEAMTRTQLGEIFVEGQYKSGLIKKDMVIIDLGANMGMASLYFRKHAKMIYAIEPSKAPYEALVKNTEKYSNIKTFNLAIMHENGPVKLQAGEKSPIPDSIFGNNKISEMVQAVTIEKFMKDNKIEHVDLLKIDCEGAEYFILPSFEFIRMSPRIDNIIGEAHRFGDASHEFIPEILNDSGFKTEFLPIDNYFKTLDYHDGPSDKIKNYKVQYQTIFRAWKEKK